MSTPQISIIPAEPGYVILRIDEGQICTGDAVIAWRVETTAGDKGWRSEVFPITTRGEGSAYHSGLLHPDKSVSFRDHSYSSIEAARKAMNPRGKGPNQ